MLQGETDTVQVYLIDRAGTEANTFGDKLVGRAGIELIGGAEDPDDALSEIGELRPDVILVGTDLGGAGCVNAIEKILAVAPDACVVALSTATDKALVSAAIRAGAAGSLDRTASPGETITALHVYKRRQLGEDLDLALAEPPGMTMSLRVSGALPVFPTSGTGPAEPGVEASMLTSRPKAELVGNETEMVGNETELHSPFADEAPLPNDGPLPDKAPLLEGEAGEAPEPEEAAEPAPSGDEISQMRASLDAKPKRRRGLRLFGRRKEKQEKSWGASGWANSIQVDEIDETDHTDGHKESDAL